MLLLLSYLDVLLLLLPLRVWCVCKLQCMSLQQTQLLWALYIPTIYLPFRPAGQQFSTRVDVLSQEFIKELEKLQVGFLHIITCWGGRNGRWTKR